MDKELKDRVFAFKTLSLPGQPTFMHMGTSYLVSDLESALLNVEAERDALRALLRRVLSCGLNEEPHGVGFTSSRQERKAGELARDIEAALGEEGK